MDEIFSMRQKNGKIFIESNKSKDALDMFNGINFLLNIIDKIIDNVDVFLSETDSNIVSFMDENELKRGYGVSYICLSSLVKSKIRAFEIFNTINSLSNMDEFVKFSDEMFKNIAEKELKYIKEFAMILLNNNKIKDLAVFLSRIQNVSFKYEKEPIIGKHDSKVTTIAAADTKFIYKKGVSENNSFCNLLDLSDISIRVYEKLPETFIRESKFHEFCHIIFQSEIKPNDLDIEKDNHDTENVIDNYIKNLDLSVDNFDNIVFKNDTHSKPTKKENVTVLRTTNGCLFDNNYFLLQMFEGPVMGEEEGIRNGIVRLSTICNWQEIYVDINTKESFEIRRYEELTLGRRWKSSLGKTPDDRFYKDGEECDYETWKAFLNCSHPLRSNEVIKK